MPIDGYTTSISPIQTAADIQKVLAKARVLSVHTDYSNQGWPNGMSFTLQTEWGPREFSLPIRAEGVLKVLKQDGLPARYLTIEHARKVAWRIALKWLQSQIALIQAGMTSLPEVMFPYLVGGWDDQTNTPITMYQKYASTQKEIEQ